MKPFSKNAVSKTVMAAVPALTLLFASAANAQEGQAPQMICNELRYFESELRALDREILVEQSNETRGSWSRFNLYANPQGEGWTLLGIASAETKAGNGIPANMDFACMLAGAPEGYPDEVKEQDWYKDIFPAPSV